LDKAVKKGVLHKNNASRGKSRLAASFNRMQAAEGAE
jgi:ribosomal protein S20